MKWHHIRGNIKSDISLDCRWVIGDAPFVSAVVVCCRGARKKVGLLRPEPRGTKVLRYQMVR